ncbi:class I SAM-dependent methyltransferase [Aestuariimicrobium soli]|uniref:class I SAM-dependent methyltransferase n=1 Tax=Aestuariimicrobium soli TaxID=2035834 RepID=UPI003EB81997
MTTTDAFDHGASHYDLLVALNPGYHLELRRAAEVLATRLGDRPGLSTLDLACGTGASTRALLGALPHDSSIVGLDASSGMLRRAAHKDWPARVRFDQAVIGELDPDDWGRGSHDGVLACYLFRNVPPERRDQGIAEVRDLLRPGGWLVAMEYSVAGNRRARRVWDAVCRGVILPLATLVGGDRHLHRYLWRSVVEFDSVTTFCDRLAAAGFTDIATRTAGGWQRGVLHTFVARAPEAPAASAPSRAGAPERAHLPEPDDERAA